MGVCKLGSTVGIVLIAIAATAGGCQPQQQAAVTHRRLIEHQALIDFSGLRPVEPIDKLNCRAAVPRNWELLNQQSAAFYTHQQWKSPSTKTGVGVAHVRMPLPISMGLLMWVAKREYTKKGNDGRILSEWTDDLGRPWFEAENDKYRVRGYVIVSRFQAWVVYFGHKAKYPPDPAELSLAARAAESVLPNLVDADDMPEPSARELSPTPVSERYSAKTRIAGQD